MDHFIEETEDTEIFSNELKKLAGFGKDEIKRCKKLQEERQDEVIRKYFMIIIRWHFNGAFMACHQLHLVHYDCGNSDGITVLPVCGIYSAH